MSSVDIQMSQPHGGTPAGESRDWKWHPNLPIDTSPVFKAPPRPTAVAKWYLRAWTPLSERAFYVLLAVIVWVWLQPGPEQTRSLEFGWAASVWFRNIIMFGLIAAFLHLWLYRWKRQEDRYRYDRRDPTETGKKFAFGDQLLDNLAYSLAGGVTIWTLYEIGYWWGYANGLFPTITFESNPVWFLLWFPLIGVWYSFHFYWVHRSLHWGPLFRNVHEVHHRNIAPGPWSGFSMHPIEHLIYLSSLLIHVVVPSHPIHVLFHIYWLTLATATSHSGFEMLYLRESLRVKMGDFYHQLHHRYFECNYGTAEMPWDRWFGSFHDGTSEGSRKLRERQKRRRAKGKTR